MRVGAIIITMQLVNTILCSMHIKCISKYTMYIHMCNLMCSHRSTRYTN